jgi:hypothetical protein
LPTARPPHKHAGRARAPNKHTTYGGLKLEQAKRLKELEKENSRLKRLVAELSLEKQILRT